MANPKRNSRILWTIVLALSLVFAISYAGRLASRAYLVATLERQAAALEAAKQHQQTLQQQLTYVQSDAYIEEVARNELGMVQPGDELLIVVDGPSNAVAEDELDPAAALEPPFWQQWLTRLGF